MCMFAYVCQEYDLQADMQHYDALITILWQEAFFFFFTFVTKHCSSCPLAAFVISIRFQLIVQP